MKFFLVLLASIGSVPMRSADGVCGQLEEYWNVEERQGRSVQAMWRACFKDEECLKVFKESDVDRKCYDMEAETDENRNQQD